MDVWAGVDWLASDPIGFTDLNKMNSAIRTLGYGQAAGSVTWNANQNHIAALGVLNFHSTGYIAQDAWTPATLQNSWVNFGLSYPNLQFRKDKQNNLVFKGTIGSGTYADATTIFTLPAAFRPAESRVLACAVVAAGGAVTACVLRADNTGAVQVFGATNNFAIHIYGSIPL